MLDEKSLRTPTWVEGHWTELADGQRWCFPRPRVRFRPVFSGGKVDVGGGPTFGPEFDASLDILLGATESTPIERLRVKFETAVRLLRANYVLDDGQLSDLLVLEPDDPASSAMFDAVCNIIMGLPPKPSADTFDAPQS